MWVDCRGKVRAAGNCVRGSGGDGTGGGGGHHSRLSVRLACRGRRRAKMVVMVLVLVLVVERRKKRGRAGSVRATAADNNRRPLYLQLWMCRGMRKIWSVRRSNVPSVEGGERKRGDEE